MDGDTLCVCLDGTCVGMTFFEIVLGATGKV